MNKMTSNEHCCLRSIYTITRRLRYTIVCVNTNVFQHDEYICYKLYIVDVVAIPMLYGNAGTCENYHYTVGHFHPDCCYGEFDIKQFGKFLFILHKPRLNVWP